MIAVSTHWRLDQVINVFIASIFSPPEFEGESRVVKSEASSRFKLPEALQSPIANTGRIAAILPPKAHGW